MVLGTFLDIGAFEIFPVTKMAAILQNGRHELRIPPRNFLTFQPINPGTRVIPLFHMILIQGIHLWGQFYSRTNMAAILQNGGH